MSAYACSDGSRPLATSVARNALMNGSGTLRALRASESGACCHCATSERMTRDASCCEASHRLNASSSCAASSSSVASLNGMSTLTGAEKPRKSERTGAEGIASKVKVWEASVSSSTRSESRHLPCSSSSLILTGMWNGSFVGWPGVAGVDWERVREYDFFGASYTPSALTVGVPAC